MEALRSMDTHELAAIEQAIFVEKDESTLSAQEHHRQKQLKEPETISLLDLGNLNQLMLGVASKEVKRARKELLDRVPCGLFQPDDKDLLVAWIGDGTRHSKGSRLPANVYEKHPSNDQLWLTDKAASYMRHMLFIHKVPITRFPSLMNCFAVLLLGRSLKLEQFPSFATLSARIYRLQLFDWQFFLNEFKSKITIPNECGFARSFFTVTDDSKHLKEDRHAALMSGLEGDQPCFKLLTTSVQQLLAGIDAGHAELSKMTKLLMSAPVAFLVLTDPLCGPLLLQTMLAIVTENGLIIEGEDWGDYKYEVEERPTSEQHWCTLLDEDKESVTRWFQEIGFMMPCVQADLQRLSKMTAEAAEPGLPRAGVSHAFKTECPVMFAALHAKFGLMPSNSQIAEQVHGGLRDSLKEGVSHAFTDAQRSFLVNTECHHQEERRKLVRENDSSKKDTESDGMKKHNAACSGAKHDRVKAT
jgi:hypothetical protein